MENDTFLLDWDSRRVIASSSEPIVGVQGDKDVNVLKFQSPKLNNGLDLSTFNISIQYSNDHFGSKYIVKNVTSDDENIYFEWVLSDTVCKLSGYVKFSIIFTLLNSDGVETKRLNTKSAYIRILDGCEVDTIIDDVEIKNDILFLHKEIDSMKQTIADLQQQVDDIINTSNNTN